MFHTSAALETANRVLQGASRRTVACHDQDSQRRRAPLVNFLWAAQPFGTSAQKLTIRRQSSVLVRLRRMTARRALRLVLPPLVNSQGALGAGSYETSTGPNTSWLSDICLSWLFETLWRKAARKSRRDDDL